jgi:hypothetical protein
MTSGPAMTFLDFLWKCQHPEYDKIVRGFFKQCPPPEGLNGYKYFYQCLRNGTIGEKLAEYERSKPR